MHKISKIRNVITVVLLLNIVFSLALFVILYNNVSELSNNKFIVFTLFVLFIGNICISGGVMIYVYNYLTKCSIDASFLQNEFAKKEILLAKLESEKYNTTHTEKAFKVSIDDFLLNFSDCNSLKDISSKIFVEISKVIPIVCAAFFVKDKTSNNFVPLSSYALVIEIIESFNEGEGLNGQVAKNKSELVLNTLEENYFNITSGLGNSQPTSLAIFPIEVNGNVESVVEFALFRAFTDDEIVFLRKLFTSLSKLIKSE